MANFEFSKKEFKLQILGMMFSIPDNEETSKKLVSFGEKIQLKAKTIKEDDNQEKILIECCNSCYKLFDSLLGDKSSEKIFKDRGKNIFDCIELINFITNEIEAQRNQRLTKYSNSRIERKQNFKKRR